MGEVGDQREPEKGDQIGKFGYRVVRLGDGLGGFGYRVAGSGYKVLEFDDRLFSSDEQPVGFVSISNRFAIFPGEIVTQLATFETQPTKPATPHLLLRGTGCRFASLNELRLCAILTIFLIVA